MKLEVRDFLKELNILDIFIISLSFLLGSLPQSQHDAVQANLYNAKWYVNDNSLKPLTESISSLFPQNAVVYYSLFFQLGGIRGLHIAYLFPLFILLFLLKKLINKVKSKSVISTLFYCFIFTPIVIFQSATGYYDLLLTVIIFAALYILYFKMNKNSQINLLASSFLIGFAGSMKYFPILFIFLPIINYYFYNQRRKQIFLYIFASLLITFLPLSLWLFRAYQYTGSPVFPYFQSLLPTPGFWPVEDRLEKNFMIQTTLNLKQWVFGGFLTYPFLTYFKTGSFLEAVRGYTGIVYLLIIVLQIIWVNKLIRNKGLKNLKKIDIFFLYAFLVYFVIGLITRYYRYLWPYQLIFSILLILSLKNLLRWTQLYRKAVLAVIFLILFINFVQITYSFKYFSVNRKQLLQPDYYFLTENIEDPTSFLNNEIENEKSVVILDATQNKIGRFNFVSKVYQCNWYWIGIIEELSNAEKDKSYANKILNKFDYIIVDSTTKEKSICSNLIFNQINFFDQIYKDKNYIVLKNKSTTNIN